jgi:GMP reductase
MQIEQDKKLDFKDVLIRPKRSTLNSRKEVSLERTFNFRNSGQTWSGVPIIAANMDGVGVPAMASALASHGMITCLTKHHDYGDWATLLDCETEEEVNLIKSKVALSVGTHKEAWINAKKIIDNFDLKWVCVDVANGYSEHFADFIKRVRSDLPHITILAGNVVTADMTQELILAGADVVKVGIGPGSVCTTRIKTGVGYPQLSAILECADAAHGLGGHIVADGGCTCPGDVAKAFGAGADFVMLGGMLAGHHEGGGEIIERAYVSHEIDPQTLEPIIERKKFVQFYGMSSDTAMHKHTGGVAHYRASEGRTVEVALKGSVQETLLDILGGVRSTCTYVGADELKKLSKCTTFIKVNHQFNTSLLKS